MQPDLEGAAAAALSKARAQQPSLHRSNYHHAGRPRLCDGRAGRLLQSDRQHGAVVIFGGGNSSSSGGGGV